MKTEIWVLAVLACPLVMGVMMFVMMRGMRRGDGRRERTDRESR